MWGRLQKSLNFGLGPRRFLEKDLIFLGANLGDVQFCSSESVNGMDEDCNSRTAHEQDY